MTSRSTLAPRAKSLAALACMAASLLSSGAHAAELALKRVMLSTGGVAYLEHEAHVTGDAELLLDVPLDAVDDVLKSLVVYDSRGGVGSARLPGRSPLSQLFKDLPFGQDALASPAALLNALQGAEIRVGASRPVTGKLLRVVPETVAVGDRASTTRNRVSVLTASGLQQFMLEDADSVSFVDAGLQAKVDKALTEIAAYRAKGRREIVLSTRGAGERTLRVGYVVASPLWKASFRLTLPQDPAAGKAQLQGWAVLENMSGQDWSGVELTLLSGDPVSFRQAIYEAYYVTRPEVPVEVAGRILPKPDSGVVAPAAVAKAEMHDQIQLEQHKVRTAGASGGGPMPAAPPPQAARSLDPSSAPNMLPLFGAMLPSRPVDTAEAQEGVTQVAFLLPLPVSVASGQSAIVPIVDREVPVERLALFQPDPSATHPLASLRVKNDAPTGLSPGVVTLYEQTPEGTAYVGDARLSSLPAGESRLISYAVDGKTKVARDRQSISTLTQATIAQGVLKLTRTKRETTLYKLVAPASEGRTLVIEHAKQNGWSLVEPHSAEETATAYRITAQLKAGEARTVTVALEIPETESLDIAEMEDNQIAAWTTDREIDPATRKAFIGLAQLRRAAADSKAAEDKLKADKVALQADQARIRENLARVDKDSALHKRYIEKLSEQETRFEALQTASERAADATRAAQAAVAAYIAGMGRLN